MQAKLRATHDARTTFPDRHRFYNLALSSTIIAARVRTSWCRWNANRLVAVQRSNKYKKSSYPAKHQYPTNMSSHHTIDILQFVSVFPLAPTILPVQLARCVALLSLGTRDDSDVENTRSHVIGANPLQ